MTLTAWLGEKKAITEAASPGGRVPAAEHRPDLTLPLVSAGFLDKTSLWWHGTAADAEFVLKVGRETCLRLIALAEAGARLAEKLVRPAGADLFPESWVRCVVCKHISKSAGAPTHDEKCPVADALSAFRTAEREATQ